MKEEFKVFKRGVTDGVITILSDKSMPFDRDKKIKKFLWLGYTVYDINGVEISLKKAFRSILREWLTPEQIAEVNRLNTEDSDCCHSHDFCDANEAMIEAVRRVFKRDIDFDNDMDLINSTWTEVKKEGF